jgi:glycine cleavage system H protein
MTQEEAMYPDDVRYTENHQWARKEDGVATVGITHYAQSQLGDLVYVELPSVGDQVAAGEAIASVESVKAVADVNSPVSGKVIEINEAVADAPEQVNEDCYGVGWMAKIEMSDPGEYDRLMNAADYQKQLPG